MKGTDLFKATIKDFLDARAWEDLLFMEKYQKEGKNLDDCITFILNEVQRSKINGYTDSEIFSMAVHYYDEDKIKVGQPIKNGNVVINRHVELTEEEKTKAREKAVDELKNEIKTKMRTKPSKPKVETKARVIHMNNGKDTTIQEEVKKKEPTQTSLF